MGIQLETREAEVLKLITGERRIAEAIDGKAFAVYLNAKVRGLKVARPQPVALAPPPSAR